MGTRPYEKPKIPECMQGPASAPHLTINHVGAAALGGPNAAIPAGTRAATWGRPYRMNETHLE